MDAIKIAVAERCLQGAETGTLDFPGIVGLLAAEGFDGYLVDYRAGTATFYLADGTAATLPGARRDVAVPSAFDAAAVAVAVGEAQRKAPGYTDGGFCQKVMAAGCAGYLVSLPGRRVVYLGRSGESTRRTHAELSVAAGASAPRRPREFHPPPATKDGKPAGSERAGRGNP